MGLLGTLRRFSRIALPQVIELSEEELSWPRVKGRPMTIPFIEPPELSRDLVLTRPDTHETTALDDPRVVELDADLLLPPFEIVDVFGPLARPAALGTIYIKKEEEVLQRGQARTKTRVEPLRLRQRLDPRERSRPVKWCKSAPPSQFPQRDAADKSTASFRSRNPLVVTSSPADPPALR